MNIGSRRRRNKRGREERKKKYNEEYWKKTVKERMTINDKEPRSDLLSSWLLRSVDW
jgi:hypothetical protein